MGALFIHLFVYLFIKDNRTNKIIIEMNFMTCMIDLLRDKNKEQQELSTMSKMDHTHGY